MTTLSTFRINQPPGTPYATWDRSRRDIDLYSVGSEAVECEAYEKSQTSYKWEFVSQPDGASVTITNDDQHTCNFQITERGAYLIRLTVNEGYPSEHATTLYFGVPLEGSGLCLPALSETNQDNSQSPYSGIRGSEEKLVSLLKFSEARLTSSLRRSLLATNTTLSVGEDNENRLYLIANDGVVVTLPDVSTGGVRYTISTPAFSAFSKTGSLQVYGGGAGSSIFVGPMMREYPVDWKVMTLSPGTTIQVVSVASLFGGGVYDWVIEDAYGLVTHDSGGYEWHFSTKDPALIPQYSNTVFREKVARYTSNTSFSGMTGWLITNEGASGDIELGLPSVSSSPEVDDSTYRFQQRGDNLITIKPAGSDKIRLPNGRLMTGYLKSTSELCYIELNLDDTNDEWKVIQGTGLWESATAGEGFYDFGGPLEFAPAAITTSRSLGAWEAGSIFSSGSGGDDPTIFTLPESTRGSNFTFIAAGTDKLRVARGGSDVIYAPDGSSFTTLETDEQNAVLKLVALGTGGWTIFGGSGTWYDSGTPANKVHLNGASGGGDVTIDTSSFDGVLSSADDTVQKALDTIDDMNLSGAGNPNGVTSGNVNQTYWDTTNKVLYINHDGSTGWYVV